MAENKFKRYLWLINTIRAFGPISFEDINNHWIKSSLNISGEDLPKKTFHNHCEMIAEIFGVDVSCERKGGYKYYFDEDLQKEKWLSAFLDSLAIQNAIEEDSGMKNRILLKEKDNHPLLPVMLDFIKNRKVISFTFFSEAGELPGDLTGDGKPKETDGFAIPYPFFCPIGMVHIGYNWYVISTFFKNSNSSEERPLLVTTLHSMKDIVEISDAVCEDYPEDFSVIKYIDEFQFDLRDNNLPDCKVLLALELHRLIDPANA